MGVKVSFTTKVFICVYAFCLVMLLVTMGDVWAILHAIMWVSATFSYKFDAILTKMEIDI